MRLFASWTLNGQTPKHEIELVKDRSRTKSGTCASERGDGRL
jgi:hypothetical protein